MGGPRDQCQYNDTVDNAIKKKRILWKEWKPGRSKEIIWKEERYPTNILQRDGKRGEIFKIANQIARTSQDVLGEKCIRNDHCDLAFGGCAKEAWKNYYSQLLNEELKWDKEHL